MERMKTPKPKPADLSKDPRWGFSPVSRRYVKRTGATWKRLVKAGVVVDEEVAEQLANPKSGSQRRPKQNAVTIKADRDAVATTIADNFSVDRLTGDQLAQIADRLEALRVGNAPRPHPSRASRKKRRPTARQPNPYPSDSEEDSDNALTSTTAVESDDHAVEEAAVVARRITNSLRGQQTPIRVSRPRRK